VGEVGHGVVWPGDLDDRQGRFSVSFEKLIRCVSALNAL